MADGDNDLEAALRDALGHLYDPSHWPLDALWAATGCDPAQGAEPVMQSILSAIESMRPAADVPADVRQRRIHDLLHLRYVQNLTSEETAQRLNITSRHLRREQREAIALLARRLLQRGAHTLDHTTHPTSRPSSGEDALPTRSVQLRQELASLARSAPGSLADVGETLRAVAEVGRILAARRGIELEFGESPPGLQAPIHPSALRQALLSAISTLLAEMTSGSVSLAAERTARGIAITVAGRPVRLEPPPEPGLIDEILANQGGSLKVQHDGDRATLRLELPPADEITVLVIDDNADIVHFYRRYTATTRYRIAEEPHGLHAIETAEAVSPQIIVLDVMLPDTDGWQLLTQLQTHPATRDLPIVVCSVVGQQELALALGAAVCLAKPVSQSEFIQALDRAACGRG